MSLAAPTTGIVAAANALVGAQAGDRIGTNQIGERFISMLPNGNLLVGRNFGDAVGADGITTGDRVGDAFTDLGNGNVVFRSASWDNVAAGNAGAATFRPGATGVAGALTVGLLASGVAGAVSGVNSVVGSTPGEFPGNSLASASIIGYADGSLVAPTSAWGPNQEGAATLLRPDGSSVGAIASLDSVLGLVAGDVIAGSYDVARRQIAAGRRNSLQLVLLRLGQVTTTTIDTVISDRIFVSSFE